ncbi:MAG TPA: ethylbenzene dehydrogenase-related protein, partial [Pseudomonadota bacterium]|nr:ethylbenzene dehydrogenase-related protein [Pseudomonadota bacterium]
MLSLAVLTMLAQGGCWGSGDEKFVGSSELKVAKTASAPSTDPRSALWNGAQETKVALMPQSIVYPLLGKQSVTSLRVRALLDDQWLAVRLEWDDRQRDDKLEVDKFTDAIAIEMPIREPQKTNPMMGSAE